MPHGFICGFPTQNGDLYGGSMYIQSAAASLTLQGAALREATMIFGEEGEGIAHGTCKYKYQPVKDGVKHVACWQHESARRKR